MTIKKKTNATHGKSAARHGKIAAFCTQNKNSGNGNKASGSGLQASGKHRVQSSESRVTVATSAITDIESRIEQKLSELHALNSELRSCAGGNGTLNSELNPEARSPKPEVRSPLPDPIALPAPPIMPPTVGSNCIHLTWGKVNNASGYILEVSNSSTFSNPMTFAINAAATSWNISGLQADTTYYLRIMSIGVGLYANSGFSPVPPVTTPADGAAGTGNDTVANLQTMLAEMQTVFQNATALVPQLETTELNTADRRRLLGSGVRRYGFIEKVFEVSGEFPQFWPPFGASRDEMNQYLREIDVLRNTLVWFRFAARVVQDLLLIAGNEGFRVANAYYALTREGARRRDPEAAQVFHMLQLFWKPRRRTTEEPTIPEVLRDVRGLMRGSKDGQITISNESDQVVKGERVIIDNTMSRTAGRNAPCAHGGGVIRETAKSLEE